MIRVLQMIGSLEMGGSQAMIMNLYRNIDREKIQFDFVLDHPEPMCFAEEIEKLGGKIYIMPTFRGTNIAEITSRWNEFIRNHPEYRILHSHVRSYASLYIPIAKKYGVKTIIHSHSTSNGSGAKALVKKILQLPLRYQADYLLACSIDSGRWLYGKNVDAKRNYQVLPNAIEVSRYKFTEEIRDKYRAKFFLNDKFVLGHVGRLHEAKNHLFLLEIMKELVSKNADVVLVLIGDGEEREKILKRISDLELNEHVLMLGNRKDVPELLQMMDCFVFPSLWEGVPLTVIEAQAAGLQCLMSDRITEDVIVSNQVKKIPINEGTDCWVDAISTVKERNNDGITAVEQSKYNIKVTISELEKIYRNLYV